MSFLCLDTLKMQVQVSCIALWNTVLQQYAVILANVLVHWAILCIHKICICWAQHTAEVVHTLQ